MKNRMEKEKKRKNETDNRFLTLAFVLIQVGDIIDLAGEGKMKTESAKKTFFPSKLGNLRIYQNPFFLSKAP